MEEYAYILDYLPTGLPSAGFSKKEPICYAVGEKEFKLFELVPKADAIINIDDRVYIGKDPELRTQIDHVKRRVTAKELTNNALAELDYVVGDIVKADQARYIRFYNTAGPISLKKHLLEELPGLGKKTMMEILDQRKRGEFKDFADLDERVPLLKGADKPIVARILLEIKDPERRHYLFVSK